MKPLEIEHKHEFASASWDGKDKLVLTLSETGFGACVGIVLTAEEALSLGWFLVRGKTDDDA